MTYKKKQNKKHDGKNLYKLSMVLHEPHTHPRHCPPTPRGHPLRRVCITRKNCVKNVQKKKSKLHFFSFCFAHLPYASCPVLSSCCCCCSVVVVLRVVFHLPDHCRGFPKNIDAGPTTRCCRCCCRCCCLCLWQLQCHVASLNYKRKQSKHGN